MMQDMRSHTWFTLSQHDEVYQTHRGSRPGSPLADLAYNSMMQAVLERLRDRLQELPQLQAAKATIGLDCPPLAWVDDVAIPFVAQSVMELDNTALTILDITAKVFQEFGLSLNTEPGKTEAVIQYRGQGSGPKTEATFVENFGNLVSDVSGTRLRIVTDYSYFGTTFAQTAQVGHEIATRIGKAKFAFRQMRKAIFCNRRLPVSTRITLLNSLVVSIVLHGAGNWPLLSTAQFNKLAHVVTGWHRSIVGTGFWSEDNVDDSELLASVQVLPMAIRLAKMRLLYAFQWYRHAPQIAVDAVTAEDTDQKSWLAAIRKAISWFLQTRRKRPPLLRPLAGLPATMNKVQHRSDEQQPALSQVIRGHRNIHQWCTSRGMKFEDIPPEEATRPGEHRCDLCSRKFSSAQALNGHLWSWHRQISEERRYIYDAVCRSCGQCFWTPQRLQQHLRYSRKYINGCLAQLREHYQPLDAPIAFCKPEGLENVHRLPKCKAAGPWHTPALPAWQQCQRDRLETLRQRGEAFGFTRTIDVDYQGQAGEALQAATLQWAEQCSVDDQDALLEMWHDALPWHILGSEEEGMTAIFQWGRTMMYDFVQTIFGDDPDRLEAVEKTFLEVAQPEPLWQWMSDMDEAKNWKPPIPQEIPRQPRLPAAGKRDIEPYVDLLLHQQQLLAPFTRCPVSTSVDPILPIYIDSKGTSRILILHLFSGRRRAGDCVEWAEYFNRSLAEWTAFRLTVVSVDTAIHPEYGNLDDGANYDRIVNLAGRGIFAADLAGPPCETWSGARHLDLGRRGPRPLRSALMTWGIPHRSCRELQQLATGSRLMLNSIRVDLAVTDNGGMSLMEHPDFPKDPSHASVWRSALHRQVVMAMPQSCELHIQQCRYGAETVKPTILRVVGADVKKAKSVLWKNVLPDVKYPTKTLGGKTDSGVFRTAAAKEYPVQMCRLLVDLIHTHAVGLIRSQKTRTVCHSDLHPDEVLWLNAMMEAGSLQTRDCWLPDYQPDV